MEAVKNAFTIQLTEIAFAEKWDGMHFPRFLYNSP